MHAAIRRDCDGDEAAIMLLGDVLLNFSKEFLPSHRGGTQDAPLVLNARINAGEVDEQILDFELVNEYPLELYKKAEQRKHSSQVKVYDVRTALKEGKEPFANLRHTHNTLNINEGVSSSNYKRLATMQEKVKHQMELVEKIRAANTSETARLIIERHFIKDMRGNLRKFSTQEFRCVKCNEKMRRPPLSGNCSRCSGKIIFTTHEGGVKKYLEPALELAKRYNLSPYIKQSLELTKRHIDSVFGKEPETQETIEKWF
jgi:DNA polymerase II large subunit